MARLTYKCIYSDDHNQAACEQCKFHDCINDMTYKKIYETEQDNIDTVINYEINVTQRNYAKAEKNNFSEWYKRITTVKNRKVPKGHAYHDRKMTRIKNIAKAKVAGTMIMGGMETNVYYTKYRDELSFWYYLNNQIYGEIQAEQINWIRKELPARW